MSHDLEYIALVARHLDVTQTKLWIDETDESWDNFYRFLEKLALKAKKHLGLNNTVSALGYNKDSRSTDVKNTDVMQRKCSICGKTHGGVCREANIVLVAKPAMVSVVSSISIITIDILL